MDRPSPLAGSRKNRMKGPAPRSGRGLVTAEFNNFVAEVPLRSLIFAGATPFRPASEPCPPLPSAARPIPADAPQPAGIGFWNRLTVVTLGCHAQTIAPT